MPENSDAASARRHSDVASSLRRIAYGPSHRRRWTGSRDGGHRVRRLHRVPAVLRLSFAALLDCRIGLRSQSSQAVPRREHLQSVRRTVSSVCRAPDRQLAAARSVPFADAGGGPVRRCGAVEHRSVCWAAWSLAPSWRRPPGGHVRDDRRSRRARRSVRRSRAPRVGSFCQHEHHRLGVRARQAPARSGVSSRRLRRSVAR